MTLTPLRRLRDRIRIRLGENYKFVRALGLASIFFLAATAVYFVGRSDGYESGRNSAVVEEFRESECRAELAAPVNSATADVSVALATGLVAAVAAEDPEVRARLEELTGEAVPADALQREALRILNGSEALAKANRDRGEDPVAACADGDADN